MLRIIWGFVFLGIIIKVRNNCVILDFFLGINIVLKILRGWIFDVCVWFVIIVGD